MRAEPRSRRGVPPTTLPARTLREELLVVLFLSLVASAVYAILSLLRAPLEGVTVTSVPQGDFPTQLADFAFGLAPVWLVVYLVRRNGEGIAAVGLGAERLLQDAARGAALFVVVAVGGIGIYVAAVGLGVNRCVVPVPPLGHWWTVPVLVMAAAQTALLEEVIVAGYLITRLRQLGVAPAAAVGASAALRGAYHLYQGWGGFAGNAVLGVLFGLIFLRTRRTWPLIVAHFLLDLGAGVGYLLFRQHLPGC